MFRQLQTEYKGRTITVTNHWIKGARLLIDGDVVAEDKRYIHLNRDEPFITYPLETMDGVETIRLFVEAIWDIKLAITVNDVLIATTHPDAVSA